MNIETRVDLVLPLAPDVDRWAWLTIPGTLSGAEWSRMLAILDAMRPAIVPPVPFRPVFSQACSQPDGPSHLTCSSKVIGLGGPDCECDCHTLDRVRASAARFMTDHTILDAAKAAGWAGDPLTDVRAAVQRVQDSKPWGQE